MQSRKNNIVLTGGHAATTALAMVEEIRKRGNYDLHWLGAKHAFEGRDLGSLESKIFPKYGVDFVTLPSGKVRPLLKVPLDFIAAFYHLLKIRPRVVVSFGGFASFPVIVSAWLLRIPTILHEQTAVYGRASKASSFFARKIALSRPESAQYFPMQKTVLTGNPILSQYFEIKPKKKIGLKPCILVTAGSRGSTFINELIFKLLPRLLAHFRLIHQVGEIDWKKAQGLKLKLSSLSAKNYSVFSVVDPVDMPKLYSRADLVISRSGANTCSEIMASRRPAILIPLTISFAAEQEKNARLLEKAGLAFVLPQKQAQPAKVLELVKHIIDNYSQIKSSFLPIANPDREAAKKLVDLILADPF